MQKIERYGVIGLLLLLVTIVAVTFWNDGTAPPAGEPLARNEAAPGANPRTPAVQQPAAGARAQNPASEPARPRGGPGRGAGAGARIEAEVPLGPAQRNPLDNAQRQGTASAAEGEPKLNFQSGAPGATAPQPAGGAQIAAGPTVDPTEGAARAGLVPERNSNPTSAERNPVRPAASAPREVRVESGDSLARIALRHMGSESHWQAIADLNGISDPKRLQAGQRLRLPALDGAAPGGAPSTVTQAPTPSSTSPAAPSTPRPTPVAGKSRLYTVQRGEVLGQIAQRECGSVKALSAIVALNPGLNPDRVVAGQALLLPLVAGSRPADTQVALSGSAPSSATSRRNVVH